MPEPHEFEQAVIPWRCDICGQFVAEVYSRDYGNYCIKCLPND